MSTDAERVRRGAGRHSRIHTTEFTNEEDVTYPPKTKVTLKESIH